MLYSSLRSTQEILHRVDRIFRTNGTGVYNAHSAARMHLYAVFELKGKLQPTL